MWLIHVDHGYFFKFLEGCRTTIELIIIDQVIAYERELINYELRSLSDPMQWDTGLSELLPSIADAKLIVLIDITDQLRTRA